MPVEQGATEADISPETEHERTQTVCICPTCINGYLSEFAERKGSIMPQLENTPENNTESADIDRNLHEK